MGYFYNEKEAEDLTEKMGWTMKEDSGRGWRMAVTSPKPKHIYDISLVESLSSGGTIVIAAEVEVSRSSATVKVCEVELK